MKDGREPNEPKPASEKEPPQNITPLEAPKDPDTAQKKEIEL